MFGNLRDLLGNLSEEDIRQMGRNRNRTSNDPDMPAEVNNFIKAMKDEDDKKVVSLFPSVEQYIYKNKYLKLWKKYLKYAVENDQSDVINKLIDKRRLDGQAFHRCVVNLITQHRTDIIAKLLAKYTGTIMDVVLTAAAMSNNITLVEMLLKDGRMNPAADNYKCLRVAASQNSRRIMDLLCSDPRTNIEKAIEYARTDKSTTDSAALPVLIDYRKQKKEKEGSRAKKYIIMLGSVDFSDPECIEALNEQLSEHKLKIVNI